MNRAPHFHSNAARKQAADLARTAEEQTAAAAKAAGRVGDTRAVSMSYEGLVAMCRAGLKAVVAGRDGGRLEYGMDAGGRLVSGVPGGAKKAAPMDAGLDSHGRVAVLSVGL